MKRQSSEILQWNFKQEYLTVVAKEGFYILLKYFAFKRFKSQDLVWKGWKPPNGLQTLTKNKEEKTAYEDDAVWK